MSDKKIILHCHIFKNAGTTLDWALERSFKTGFCDHRDDEKMRRGSLDYLDGFLHDNRVIVALSSHHMPFFPEHDKPYFWIVLLREPLQRVRSVYEFEVRQPVSSLGSKMAKKLSFSEYINWRMQEDVPAVIKNHHLRYLNNITNPALDVNELVLEKAVHRLNMKNVLVGTVEKFDESMVFFEELLKKQFPEIDLSYVKQNTGRKEVDSPLDFLDDLPPETRSLLIESNQWDKKLYDMMCVKQKTLISGIPDFEKKLCDFKERSRLLSVKKNG